MLILGRFSMILLYLISSQHLKVLTDEVSFVKSLLELFYSTIDACGHVKWCTVQTEDGEDKDDFEIKAGCCFHCSCNKSCLQEQNCCPDYRLRHLLVDKPFSNVTKFISELDRIENTTTHGIEIRYERNDVIANKTFDCVRSQLLEVSPYRPYSPSYRMITTCSSIHIHANAYLKRKCEDVKLSTNSSVTDYLPIQSMESGIIYRNKYCLQCSDEPTARALKWELLLKCFSTPKGFLTNQIPSMKDILVYMVQMNDKTEFYDCNIYFEPGTIIRQKHPPDVCTEIHVKSCRQEIVTNTNKNTSDVCGKMASSQEVQNTCRNKTYISRDVVNACQNYFSPVYIFINGKVTTFNNMACISCYGLLDDTKPCYVFNRWHNLTPFVGRIQAQYFDENDSVDSDVKIPDVIDRHTLPCRKGYIYDSFTTKCRKLYCPCGMVEYMTTCVPIFEDIQDRTNLIQVYITAQEQPIDKQTDFELKLFNYFSNSFDTNPHYRVKYVRLLKALVRANRGKVEYITYLCFSAEIPDVTILEKIKTVGKLFRGQKVIEAGTNLNVNMALTNDLIAMWKDKYSVIFQNGSIDEIVDSNLLIIRECNFCNRVELFPHEIKRHMQGLPISNTGHTILRQDITRDINNNTRLMVCARYVIGTTSKKKVSVANEDSDVDVMKISNPAEKSENWEKNNAFLYCIFALVLISSLVYIYLRCKKPIGLQGPTTINQIELASVNTVTFDQ